MSAPAEIRLDREKAGQAKSAAVVAGAIMCSRLLGLVREMLLGALFGGNKWMDCFIMAFRTPNMMRDLFAEGALSTAFVTTFTKKIEIEGDRSAWRLAQKMATLTAVFMSFVVVAGIVFAPVIIRILAPWWPQDKIEFTVLLARIMYPFIGIVSLSALVMGMLNARRVFGIPALASSFFNLGSMIGGGLIGWRIDPEFGRNALIGFAFGTLIGGLAQLTVQLPVLWKVGFRPRLDFRWRDSGVKKILALMGPAVVAGSAVQVNVLLNNMFASYIAYDGAVSWLGWAFRLMQLPLGVFGVAVAVVTLPAVSRAAAHGISDDFRVLLSSGVRQVLFLTVPSALGLFFLAEPIITLIFERGRFDAHDTRMTALALQYYVVGLTFYAGVKVLQPAFYAIDRKYVPMLVGFATIGLNAGLNWFFVVRQGWGHQFLALSTGFVATMNFLILYAVMWKTLRRFDTAKTLSTLARIAIAGLVLAGICLAGQRTVLQDYREYGLMLRIVTLFAVIGAAAAAYFGVTAVLRVEETGQLLKAVRSRLRSAQK